MPTYGYECTACKEQFEVIQKMTDAPLAIHDECGGELRRLLYPVGIVFKGPGFYVNDYAKKSASGSTESKAETKPEKADAKSESKAEVKTESASTAKTE